MGPAGPADPIRVINLLLLPSLRLWDLNVPTDDRRCTERSSCRHRHLGHENAVRILDLDPEPVGSGPWLLDVLDIDRE